MTNKFKVGDKVRVIDTRGFLNGFDIGDIARIFETDDSDIPYHIEKENGHRGWAIENSLMLISNFTKDDLQTGDVVTLRNGDKLFIDEHMEFRDIDTTNNTNYLGDLDELSSDLLYQAMDGEKNDIIKVERPTYTTVFERDEEVKEMTLKEICDALGYEVKIIKEDE